MEDVSSDSGTIEEVASDSGNRSRSRGSRRHEVVPGTGGT